MNIIRILLVKDLKRTLRNPTPFLTFIAIPLLITGLIGMTFSNMSQGGGEGVAPIRIGIVDEDDSIFSQSLNGAIGQEEFKKHIDAQFLEREEALKMIKKGKLSAVLIIPEGFTDEYLSGEDAVKLTLVKNPSEYLYPTLAQEGSELIVTALNTVARNFRKDLQELNGLLDDDREFDFLRDITAVIVVVDRSLKRLDAADDYLTPPLVTYEKETQVETVEENKGQMFSLFSFLLVGMAAMFMLMLADNCMRDLYRESRFRTLERFRTLREGLFPFVASKVIYTVVVLLIAAVILFGGGCLIFQFQWQNIGLVTILVISYSIFGAGLMGFIAALAGRERRADILNNLIAMSIAITGGTTWPPDQLPPIIRDHITPLSPAFWFSSAVRGLQSEYVGFSWVTASGLLVGLGLILVVGAARVFQIRLEKGIRE